MFTRKRNSGFTLVEIMIVVAIIALLAAIAIPNLAGSRRAGNTATARANIKSMCTEAENIASTGNGEYPDAEGDMTARVQALCGATEGGYTYECAFAADGYTFTATRTSANTGDVNEIEATTGCDITES